MPSGYAPTPGTEAVKPALFLLVLGCVPEEPAAPRPAPPPGTVLLVDGLPLAAGELAPMCADILALYPEFATVHARRLALTNEFLPRLAARARDPQGCQRAREECERASARLDALVPQSEEGTFHGLGLSLWSAARHLPVGEWSGPLELAGRWLRLRLDERIESADPREERLRVSVLEFPFLDDKAVEEAIDRAHLVIVDAGFDEAVPETWKQRMHASEP
jgi:hypothetical protein